MMSPLTSAVRRHPTVTFCYAAQWSGAGEARLEFFNARKASLGSRDAKRLAPPDLIHPSTRKTSREGARL